MRDIIRATVRDMDTPDVGDRDAARAKKGDIAAHDAYLAQWPCLATIEAHPPAAVLAPPEALTVAAWNMERCKRVEDSAELIRQSGADVVLATEMDHGMARSGQRHTTRDLARLLGFGYVYGTEFVELGVGDDYEAGLFADTPNLHGLHGNAILSRYPLVDPALIPLTREGHWFAGVQRSDAQVRVGGRMALAAQVMLAQGPLTLVSAHFESESDAVGRADQADRIVGALDGVFGAAPTVIGGDLNTAALSEAGLDRAQTLNRPEDAEPCFARFAAAGYDWRTANTGAPTTRAAPGKPVTYPLMTLDWLLVRGASACEPRVIAAVSGRGDYLSDHECIAARICL